MTAVLQSRSRLEQVTILFGRSRCEGPAPGSGSIFDKTEEILNDLSLFIPTLI